MAIELFKRYEPLRDELKKLSPDLYSDLPERDIPQAPEKDEENKIKGSIPGWYLKTLLDDLNEILVRRDQFSKDQVTIPSMKVSREGVFFAGQYFDALQRVMDILAEAKRSIVIIDGYVDEKVLSLLSSKGMAVEVSVLTKSVPAALNTAAIAFNRQYGKLSIRTSSVFHDRFVIVDDQDFYHFGASIKDLGNRGFMFSLIEELVVIDALRKQWIQEWANATVVV